LQIEAERLTRDLPAFVRRHGRFLNRSRHCCGTGISISSVITSR
jgi:hypothetical protein